MNTDRDLVQRYLRDGSQDAFAEIVRRHIDLVYGVAFRQLRGNASLAEDVTQAVFTALAAKAAALPDLPSLSSWLYTTTRYTVSHTVRSERRRQDRETKAYAMNEATPSDPASPEIPAELMGTALDSLDNEEREAVLLRFVEGQAFSAVGLALGISEDAARMRVNRAIEKVRAFFARRGITSTAAAFAAALASEGMAAPAGLAGGVSTTALAAKAAAAVTGGGGFFASLSAAKVTAALSGAIAVAAVAYALRPAARPVAPVPLSHETVSQHLAALQSKKAVSATGLEQPTEQAARPAASSVDVRKEALVREEAEARKHADENAEQATLREKMMKLKPLLASGAPITGTFVTTRGGQVTDVAVTFSLGKETRVDLGDSGSYAVSLKLNDDGSLAYAFKKLNADSMQPAERASSMTFSATPHGKGALTSEGISIVAPPWSDFTLGSPGSAIGFVPNQTEPQ